MIKASDLTFTSRILQILLIGGNLDGKKVTRSSRGLVRTSDVTYLVKHEVEEHVQPGVFFHCIFEFLHDRVEWFGMLVNVRDGVLKELVVMSFVLWEPLPSLWACQLRAGAGREQEGEGEPHCGFRQTYSVHIMLIRD